jgi:hypothetical protein
MFFLHSVFSGPSKVRAAQASRKEACVFSVCRKNLQTIAFSLGKIVLQ